MDGGQEKYGVSRFSLQDRLREAGVFLSEPSELLLVAENLLADGEIDEALDVVRFAVSLAPEDWRVLRCASNLFARARKYARSDEIMRRVVKLVPDNAECRLHYASILLELREFSRARRELDEHFKLAPNSSLGYRTLSSIFASQGDFSSAYKATERALEIEPARREFAIHRAWLLITMERVSEALQALRKLETEDPGDAGVIRLISSAYEVAGDFDPALRYAEKAYQLAPGNPEYERHVDYLQKHLGAIRGAAGEAGGQSVVSCPSVFMVQSGLARWEQAFFSMMRVISSVLIREFRTRFGGMKLGYVWAIFEPVAHLALIAIVFYYMHATGGAPIGDSLLVFYFTGVLNYLLFNNTITFVQSGLESNKALLKIPVVKPLDVLIARAILELFTMVIVAILMLTSFHLFGLKAAPYDIVKCVKAVIAVWILAAGFGMVNCVILHVIKSWDQIFFAFSRSLYFISGIFYPTLAMPTEVRDILQWNPLLQAIELFRSGFFAGYDPFWLNTGYLYAVAAAMFVTGLCLERVLRRKMSSPTW
ncbi:MAG: ABC transporter permease [Alphaproteobacteria bacterium]|nr:ABC transporter permease [Alphaproteobacteria bacterium]